MLNRLTSGVVRGVSMFFRALGWRACRFHPTCSEYASEAFGRFAWLKAVRLSLWRFFRCHPFCKGGFDPVP